MCLVVSAPKISVAISPHRGHRVQTIVTPRHDWALLTGSALLFEELPAWKSEASQFAGTVRNKSKNFRWASDPLSPCLTSNIPLFGRGRRERPLMMDGRSKH
ncbi:hypothetical protein E2C01_076516 [Portunus trituberculatus]|uniref:Uncharacterized protein n=1 Tax=Portunus trituberculatus TaxID=210409 RepID=A0A5B7IM90_PORTR|nr:hypothetical protein [Portunus trituberculatus]